MKKSFIPFDLAKAKEGKKVYTRDGAKIDRFLSFEARGKFPVVFQVQGADGIFCCTKEGVLPYHSEPWLIHGPRIMTGYINVYPASVHEERAFFYDTLEEALSHRGAYCIATVPIKWEDQG